MMYRAIPQILAEDIARGNCVLFVGAGLSMAYGLPGWRDLIKQLCENLGVGEDTDPLRVAQVYEYREGRQRLNAHIISRTQTSSINPKDLQLHIKLANLGVTIWITTNYDDLIEKAFDCEEVKKCIGKICKPVIRDEDISYLPQNAVILIKLHGDNKQPSTLTVTKNDYFTYPQRFPLITQKVADLLTGKTFLFIGYSLQDPDFSQLQAKIAYHLEKHARKAYAVLDDIDNFNWDDLASRNIHIIKLSEWGNDDRSLRLQRFLTDLENEVNLYKSVPKQEYTIDEAKNIIPENILGKKKEEGFVLAKCVEYLVHCRLVDEAQHHWLPHGWIPYESLNIPEGFQTEEYSRMDDQKNIWLVITIWQKEK